MVVIHPRIKVCSSGEEAELLIPPHLDLETYPGWLRKRALERKPEYKDAWPNSDADAVSAVIASIDAWDWLDHWGTAIYAGKEHLVSEPYHMNRERIDQLLRFCNELNLAVNIQASGHHYPTKTMRIFAWPKEWTKGDYFLQEKEGYRDGVPSGERCFAESGLPTRHQVPHRTRSGAKAAAGAKDAFALEKDLRDYLARNLNNLENGMTLWPVERGQRAVEFRVNNKNRRIDILARDADGIPTVIETKVHRGHERTVGQVLFYQDRVRNILNVEKVRVLIVAEQVSAELKAATASLPDVSLIEYSGTKTFRKL
ncbi:MAG: endonuclease NucS domain-containing protein [Terriglobia bacterium]